MSLLSVDSLSVRLIFLYSWWCTVHKYTVRPPCSSSPSSRSTGDRCGPRSSRPGPADSLRGKKSCLCARIGRPTAHFRPDTSKISFYPRSTCWSAGSRGCCCRREVRTVQGRLGADPWHGPVGQPIGLAEIRCALWDDPSSTGCWLLGYLEGHNCVVSEPTRWDFLSLVRYGHCGHSQST